MIVLDSVWASEASSRDAWQLDFDVLTSSKDPTLASRAVPHTRIISHGGGHVVSRKYALGSRSSHSGNLRPLLHVPRVPGRSLDYARLAGKRASRINAHREVVAR